MGWLSGQWAFTLRVGRAGHLMLHRPAVLRYRTCSTHTYMRRLHSAPAATCTTPLTSAVCNRVIESTSVTAPRRVSGMVGEVVSVHVGQCGLQLGSSFWHQLLTEHTHHQLLSQHTDSGGRAGKGSIGSSASEGLRASSPPSTASSLTASVDTFFHPLDSASVSPSSPFPYRARAVLVDMEAGVLSALSRSSQSGLFDSSVSVVSDVSGSGNNYAAGYCVYGPQYGDSVLECVRRQVERCECLQAFILSHSTGGGTGSGLGSYILEQLTDCYGGL